jgi:hypothetical protein
MRNEVSQADWNDFKIVWRLVAVAQGRLLPARSVSTTRP